MVVFTAGRRQFRAIEQNPETRSRWAALARAGGLVLQITYRGRFVAVAVDGVLRRYPAWKAERLPA
jgi:hypothetical protein